MEDHENDIEILNSSSQIYKSVVTIQNDDSKLETEHEKKKSDDDSKLETEREKNKISVADTDCNYKKSATDSDRICRIAFNDKEDFENLKNGIIGSLSNFFESKNIHVEFQEGTNSLEISIIKTLKKDNMPLFMISVDASPKLTSQSESIPSYRRSIKDALDFGKLNESIETCERPKTNLCFNCSGSHALKDCPEPRNQQKINKARKQFQTKNERYHIDVDQRLAHIKPGKLSSSLKNALGLRSKELPSFFYRMRILGYPPGWLEDSKIANSGIALIDSEDSVIPASDIAELNSEPEEQHYDISKIISFPGYNVDPGSGYYDDYKYHNVPAMQSQQKKENFIKTLGGNLPGQGYKRKKSVSSKRETDKLSEIEIKNKIARLNETDFLPMPLKIAPIEKPLDTLIQHPISEPSTAIRLTESGSNQRSSPSLADLEAKQTQLLEALQTSILSENSFSNDSNLKINCESELSLDNSSININTSLISETNNSLETLDTTLLLSNKKASVLGTPVLKFSVFDQLPNGDNFKEGVSDVINFENLPDSTGKYEEMKIVLNKVRMRISKLNSQKN